MDNRQGWPLSVLLRCNAMPCKPFHYVARAGEGLFVGLGRLLGTVAHAAFALWLQGVRGSLGLACRASAGGRAAISGSA